MTMTDKEIRIARAPLVAELESARQSLVNARAPLVAELAAALKKTKPKEPLLTSGLAVGQKRQWWKCCEAAALACALTTEPLAFLADCGYDGPETYGREDY